MHLKYLHYFGNESSESLLEAYGIVTKDNIPIDTLNPKKRKYTGRQVLRQVQDDNEL